MQPTRPSIWSHDSNETASGKPGTLHYRIGGEIGCFAGILATCQETLIDSVPEHVAQCRGTRRRKPQTSAVFALTL